MKYSFGDLVELVNEANEKLELGINDVVGCTIDKRLIPTIANLIQTDLQKYIIVKPKYFVMNPRTHGVKIGFGYNSTDRSYLATWNNYVFRVKKEMENVVISDFLALYFLRDEFDRESVFKSWGSSTIVFLWDSFAEMTIEIPSIDKQKAVLKQYQTVTKRIETLRKINDNLEAQATTIFKEYVASATNESSIYDILTVINGAAFSSEYFNTDNIGLPLVRIRDLKSCVPEVWTSETLGKAEYIHSGDILIGMDGEFVPYIWYGAKSLLNQRVCKVVPKQGVHPFFLYATLKPILAEIERTQGGTTVIHLGKKDFDKMVCSNIDNTKHSEFYKKVEPIYSLIIKNHQEILALSDVNKSLLSHLSR